MMNFVNLRDLQDLRFLTMAFLAHDGLIRYSELQALTRGDIQFSPQGHLLMTIQIFKTTPRHPSKR